MNLAGFTIFPGISHSGLSYQPLTSHDISTTGRNDFAFPIVAGAWKQAGLSYGTDWPVRSMYTEDLLKSVF